jgi:hypothetical protein
MPQFGPAQPEAASVRRGPAAGPLGSLSNPTESEQIDDLDFMFGKSMHEYTSQKKFWEDVQSHLPGAVKHLTAIKYYQKVKEHQKAAATSSSAASSSASANLSGMVLRPRLQAKQEGHGFKGKLKFGNYLIDAKKLKKNILSISYQNGSKVPGFPNVKISDTLKKVFMKQKVNTKKLNLTDNEKRFLHKLMEKSDAEVSNSKRRLMGPAPASVDVNALKDRLDILIGSIDAGNNNPAIKDEIGQTMTTFVQANIIPREQASAFMKEYVENI